MGGVGRLSVDIERDIVECHVRLSPLPRPIFKTIKRLNYLHQPTPRPPPCKGSCLYSTPPPGPPSPAPAPTPPSFALRYPEIFTLTAIGTLFASALLLAGYLIHADLSSSTLKPPPSPQPPRHAPHMPRLPRQPTRVPTGPLHSPLLQFDHSAPEIEEGGGTGRADARARGGGGGGFSLEEVAVRPGSPGQAPEDEDEDALRESQRRDYARLESHFAVRCCCSCSSIVFGKRRKRWWKRAL